MCSNVTDKCYVSPVFYYKKMQQTALKSQCHVTKNMLLNKFSIYLVVSKKAFMKAMNKENIEKLWIAFKQTFDARLMHLTL